MNPQLGKYDISLKMDFPPGTDATQWAVALYVQATTQVPGSLTVFDSNGVARIQFDHFPPVNGPGRQIHQVKVGRASAFEETGKWLKIPKMNDTIADIEVYDSQYWQTCAFELDLAMQFSPGVTWWGYKGAITLLRMFLTGSSASNEAPLFIPTIIRDVTFNCFNDSPRTYLHKELSHNSGAPFDDAGNATIKDYVFGETSYYGRIAGSASSLKGRGMMFWQNQFAAIVLNEWDDKPVGYQAWWPSDTGWKDLSENPYFVMDMTDEVDPDVFASFGQVHVRQHLARYFVKKTASSVLEVKNILNTGVFIDIYDFSIVDTVWFPHSPTVPPAHQSAVMQLGYGLGNKSGSQEGQIFRYTVNFYGYSRF